MGAATAVRRRRAPAARGLAPALVLPAIVLLAGALRLLWFARVPPNPWYDAAVRSMGLSWHSFFYGAFDPSGALSVDKAPVDLWLQVGATKLLGFTSTSLRIPQAIAGITTVVLLHGTLRRAFDRTSAAVAAVALAVLPVSVLTSRSDTMDTLMGTALTAAAWLVVAAPPSRRPAAVVAAGAMAGLAFEIKLFEAVVALPALGVLGWRALGDDPARVRTLRRAGMAFLAVACAWPVAATVLPGGHPWPLGSSDGKIWNVVLVYNGLDRLGASGPSVTPVPPAGPLRLFTTADPDYLAHVGVVLAIALAVGGFMVVWRGWLRPPDQPDDRSRLQHAVLGALALWLVLGLVLFSVQGRVRLRYLEAFTPAVAGMFGLGIVATVRAVSSRPQRANVVAAGLAALCLTQPLLQSVALGRAGAEDSQTLGAMDPRQLASLSRYLRTHRRGAEYQVAAIGSIVSGPLIVRNAEPVLFLSSWHGRPLTSPVALASAVRSGRVRHLLMYADNCVRDDDPYCPPSARWALRHGTDVSAEAGLGRGLVLLHLTGVTA